MRIRILRVLHQHVANFRQYLAIHFRCISVLCQTAQPAPQLDLALLILDPIMLLRANDNVVARKTGVAPDFWSPDWLRQKPLPNA